MSGRTILVKNKHFVEKPKICQQTEVPNIFYTVWDKVKNNETFIQSEQFTVYLDFSNHFFFPKICNTLVRHSFAHVF